MSDKFKNAGRRLTKEELDAIEESNKPLKPLPPLPSGGMGGKKGGVVKKKIIKAQIGRYMNEDKQREEYRKRLQEYQAQREISRMPRQISPMEESSRMPMDRNPESEALDQLYKQSLDRMMQGAGSIAGEPVTRKKGGMTKAQKKVGTVMREFKKGKLHSGKKGPVVKNPKQAIAIALSESGQSKKMMGGMMSDGISNKGSGIEMKSKGGMVRGQGIALRGTKFKGVF